MTMSEPSIPLEPSMAYYSQHMLCLNCGYKFKKDFAHGDSCSGSWECERCGMMKARETGPILSLKKPS